MTIMRLIVIKYFNRLTALVNIELVALNCNNVSYIRKKNLLIVVNC